MLLHFSEHSTCGLSFCVRAVDLFHQWVTLFMHFIFEIVTLFIIKFTSLNNPLNLLLNLLVLLLKQICFSAQIVHIIIEGVVLLFSLDKSWYSFLNARDTSGFANLFKCVLHCRNVLYILVHELFLALVGCNDLWQPQTEYINVIWKVTNWLLFISLLLVLVGIIFNCGCNFFFSELLTHLLDLIFEGLLIFFVLCS